MRRILLQKILYLQPKIIVGQIIKNIRIMKKTFALMTVVLVAAVAFTSCTKEGQYNPKKKISKIVYASSGVEPLTGFTITDTTKEVWTWEGDILSYIDYYNHRGNRTHTALFRYDDKKRIKEIDDNDRKLVFDYDDNLIEEIEYYDRFGSLEQKVEFEHTGNKITAIIVEGSADYGQKSFNPLRYFIPEDVAETMMKNASKGTTTRYDLTWTGKNVTKMECVGQTRATWNYSYDNKINPFKGFFDLFTSGYLMLFSANNITKTDYSGDDGNSTVDYSYVYDGKYPVKKQYEGMYYGGGLFPDHPMTFVTEYIY